MTKKELGKYFDKKTKETHNEGNIFAPPISGQECFDVLTEHFLLLDVRVLAILFVETN